MKAARQEPTLIIETNQAVVEHAANAYLGDVLGPQYSVSDPVRDEESWRFLVRCRWPGLDRQIVVGQLQAASTGEVARLSDDDLQDMRERVAVRVAKDLGEVARDENGIVLPYQAKIRVNGYMGGDVIFFAHAEGRPEWIPGDTPHWRVTTILRMPNLGKVCELGTVDVNALTGEVVPLSASQIKSMQRKASNAVARAKRSATSDC